jgi:hypothetical protein
MNKKLIFLFIILFGLTGCLSGSSSVLLSSLATAFIPQGHPIWLQEIEFQIGKNMNNNAPVAIHVLVIYKKRVWEVLTKMNSKDYFNNADQLYQQYGDNIDRFTYEAIPGINMIPAQINLSNDFAEGILVFARYATTGDHRRTIDGARIVLIHLYRDDFEIQTIQTEYD